MPKIEQTPEKSIPSILSNGRSWPAGTTWVIYNPLKYAIWDRHFDTYESAKAEFDLQTMSLKPGQVTRYEIRVLFPGQSISNSKKS